jgi:hypothetical protein
METLVLGAGEGGHGKAVGEGGGVCVGLERLAARRGEEDRIEVKGVGSGGGDGEVAAVGRVEGAAEQSDAHRLFPFSLGAVLLQIEFRGFEQNADSLRE